MTGPSGSGTGGFAASPAGALLAAVRRRATTDAGRRWLTDAVASVERRLEPERFAAAFAATGRRVGRQPVALAPSGDESLSLDVARAVAGRGLDEVARVALLVAAASRLDVADLAVLVEQVWTEGDTRERQAILRALPLLPGGERFRPLAYEACRTSIVPLFEAIACENPYPAAHFDGPAYNQMVLKALSLGVAVDRIVGLDTRIDAELTRMAREYAGGRRAAGRAVPPDVWRLLAGAKRPA